MSLLDINPKDFGYFDFIVCIGVLHHLEYPQSGLNKLRQVLKPDGGMYIMVYGEIGRTGVYQMQDLLNMVNKNTNNFANKIINFKNIYSILPSSNLLKKTENVIRDHNTGDNGIIDELLNLQDRAYTVSELYKFVKSVGMNIVEFSPMDRYKYKFSIPNIDYKNISKIEKYSINELFFGDICKHSIYISNRTNTIALIDDLDNIKLREKVMFGAFLSAVALMNSGTGPAAAMSYPLGVHYGVPHGIGGAIFLPHVIEYNISQGYYDYIKLYSKDKKCELNKENAIIFLEQMWSTWEKLNIPEEEYTSHTRIIVVEYQSKSIGFIVDEVNEVLRIESSIIEQAPDMTTNVETAYISGVAKLENRLLILLDLDKILIQEDIELGAN